MNDEKREAWETMEAFRRARDTHLPGSQEFKLLDEEYKKAEAAFYNVGK